MEETKLNEPIEPVPEVLYEPKVGVLVSAQCKRMLPKRLEDYEVGTFLSIVKGDAPVSYEEAMASDEAA